MRLPRRSIVVLVFAGLVSVATATRAADEEDKPLPPEDVTLKTRDGVNLVATYYPGDVKKGKNVVPVILLHSSKGTRGDLRPLALALQAAGHAVIAPDLRGHGDSTGGGGARRPADYLAMVTQDVETVKDFLIDRNNQGELNIEKLCLVGTEMGSVVALNFAARDWSWPVLATGKQGQDVKALVLISPEWSYRGLRINEAVTHPQVRSLLSMMIIAGEGSSKVAQEAKRLYAAFERYHPAPPPEEVSTKQSLWLRLLPTSLQDTQLVNEKSMLVDQIVVKFIELRLVNAPYPWSQRVSPVR
jgi:pimeloyl-ACP methyl ester carboxylesterase